MGQHEVVVDVEHRQGMRSAVLALAQRVDPTSYRCYALTTVQGEPLHKGRMNLPAAGSPSLLDRRTRPEHHPRLDVANAPAPVRFDDLRLEQCRPWHPTGLGGWTLCSLARRLAPRANMRQECQRVVAIAIAQTYRHTGRRQLLAHLMHHALRHRPGAGTSLDGPPQLPLGIEGRPYPVAGALQAVDRFLDADLAIFDATQHGIHLIELSLFHVHVAEERG